MTRTIMTDTTTSSFKNKLNCVKSCQCISVQRQRKNSLYVLCMYTPARERQRERCRRGDEPSKTREPIHYPFALPRRESFPLLPFSFPSSFALSPSLSLSLSLALSLSLPHSLTAFLLLSLSLAWSEVGHGRCSGLGRVRPCRRCRRRRPGQFIPPLLLLRSVLC